MDQKLKEQMCDRIIESNNPPRYGMSSGSLVGGFVSILIGNELLNANNQDVIVIDESSTSKIRIKSNKRDNAIRWPKL